MFVTRLVLLFAALVLLARGRDARTTLAVQQEVAPINTTANQRHRIEKDDSTEDHRQGRMALHAELPSSKVKREQALRNILAARRRQLLGPRVSEVPKNLTPWPRTPRPALAVSKDPLDMLEAQETRHGVYVTAPIGDQVAIVLETEDEDLASEGFDKTESSTLSTVETFAKSDEQADRPAKNSVLIRINEANDKSPKNVSQSSTRAQKNSEPETRRKNIVAMPESLYNHFRPVESNIPVEDMTQFLYFGQKIHPEIHNSSTGTNNSILDTTSTSASVPISRRRYSMKRFSTTTAIPVPQLEEMINEEMNIALERSTIERNKIPKTKNVFRSPGSGTYFRKTAAVKPSDQPIVSNVIPTRESARNASAEPESTTRTDPSANAYQINQVAVVVGDRGSSSARSVSVPDNTLAHRARNTTIGNVAAFQSETETPKTENNNTAGGLSISIQQLNTTDDTMLNDQSAITKPIEDSVSEASINTESSTIIQMVSTTNYDLNDEKSNKITTWQFVHSHGQESTTLSIGSDKVRKVTMSTINNLASTMDPNISSTNPTVATTPSLAHSSLRIVVTEPMGYESGTRASWESAEAAEDSKHGDAGETEEGEANGKAYRTGESPVNQADSRKDRGRHRVGESVRTPDRARVSGLPSNLPTSGIIASSGVNISSWSSNGSDSPPRPSGSPNTDPSVESTLLASLSSEPEHLPASSTEKTEHKHAYAYEITNVTRLLRNYTGPGVNVVMDRQVKEDKKKKEIEDEAEEEEKRKNSSKKKLRKLGEERDEEKEKEEGEKEEERGSTLTRTNSSSIQKIRNDGGSLGQPTPQQQSTLPLLLLPTLQRASSSSGGIVEPAARTPGVLSAGTDVDEATASTTSSWNTITSTGGAPIIKSASSGGNSGARPSRTGDSSTSSSQSPSASSSSSSSSASSSSSSTSSSSSSSSSTSLLVGERGRKGPLGARQQYHQQNQNRGIAAAGGRASALSAGSSGSSSNSHIGTRNTSVSTPVTSTEVSGASTAGVEDYVSTTSSLIGDRKRIDEVTENILVTSTIRWNHTGTKKFSSGSDRHEGYGNDRRYLRKPVSAVLNQRPIDESIVKELKRRRESTLQSSGSVDSAFPFSASLNSRRIKGFRSGINEDSKSSSSRPMENITANAASSADGQSTTSQSTTKGREDALSEESDKISEVSDKMTEEQAKVTVDLSVNINQTTTQRSVVMEKLTEAPIVTTVSSNSPQVSDSNLAEENSDVTDKNLTSAKIAQQGQVTSAQFSNLTEQVTPSALSGNSESDTKSERTEAESSDTVATTPIILGETSESIQNVETTIPPPAFPVTPRMLKDEVIKNVENSAADDEQTKKVPEASRPFGLAKDLDPSEIQKMYRSQTTIKPDLVMTTIIPGFMDTSTVPDLNPEDNPTRSAGKDHPATISPVNSSVTRKPVAAERSPEVRGRNLSDKIKDKDDVLPIMQLYNTSDIFNGTKDSKDSGNDSVSTVLLPGAIEVNATNQRNDSELHAGAATLVPDVSESPKEARKGEESRPQQKHQHGNSDSELTGISKKSRQGASREETHDSMDPTRWSNHTNSNNSYTSTGGQSNRTRHRPPLYYDLPPPGFTGFHPEFNGSFFEPGMISVSSRESVNISEVITRRHDGDTIATQETVAVVSYILATLVVFPIAVGVGLILRRLIIRNRKVLEESDTSSEISCRKDALNLEKGDFKTSIEKAITKLPRIQHLCHEAEKPPPPPSQESRWEFPRDKLRLQTVLGQGNFGQVWKAEADDLTGHQGTTRLVAVKTVKEGASAREKEDLIRELEIMQQLGNHSNVVTLLGCCTEEEPHYLILEYVMYGKLLAYLRDHRTRQDFYNFSEDSAALTSRDLTVFGYCVARGMEYLASKKIIHRDLAARNVLVDHNKLCKIADFGMSRFANDDGEVIEARHGRNALPIRWMAPESLIYSLFTTKTDVWSFGILMWEIVTLGSTPYPDMAAREVMRNVQNGYRLERPSHCRSELFRVISRCWHADPDRRPEFQILRRDMAQLLEDSMNGHYVDLESFASECTD